MNPISVLFEVLYTPLEHLNGKRKIQPQKLVIEGDKKVFFWGFDDLLSSRMRKFIPNEEKTVDFSPAQ
jgi:hypothetical protein